MKNLFEGKDGDALVARIEALQPAAQRQWGKMSAAQMLAHCAIAVEAANGDRPMKQVLIGKLLTPFVRKAFVGPKPFTKNSPTGPVLIVSDPRDFAAEKARLLAAVERLRKLGPEGAARHPHGFVGKVSGEEWGALQWKHLDHHLRQFNG